MALISSNATNKSNSIVIIIDGMDNTGKSTIINKLYNLFDNTENTCFTIHFDNPLTEAKLQGKNIEEFTKDQIETITKYYYSNMLDKIDNLEYIKRIYLLDRSWLSEYVYGPMYRNRDENDVINDIMSYEYRLLSQFGYDNIYMFLLTSNNIPFLQQQEDGKSLSKVDGIKLKDEYKKFKEIFDMSLIKHKFKYDIYDNVTKFYNNSIYPTIVKNILYNN